MRRVLSLLVLAFPVLGYAAVPELPRILIDTSYRKTTPGSTTTVASGANLQTAINAAACGDTLELEAGATFTGNFTLPDKDCTDSTWVYIRTATPDGTFPRPGNRIGVSHASLMAKLASASSPVLASDSDADHYRLVGLEMTLTATGQFAIVDLSAGQGTANQTNNITFDRCYIRGYAAGNSQRGITANAAYVAVIDSYISDIHWVGGETQAFALWNGSGPFKLYNNYLEAATETVLFGGADSTAVEYLPADIEIRRNHFFKPFTWYDSHVSYAGIYWSVKNILELKVGKRVLIENNLFENNWVDAQTGAAILFTIRNQDGAATWSTVEDVTFRSNHIKRSAWGINILATDSPNVSGVMERLSITDNVLESMDIDEYGDGGTVGLLQVLSGPIDLVLENNTERDSLAESRIVGFDGGDAVNLVWRYNITNHFTYGIIGASTATGSATLTEWAPGATFTENVMIGGSAAAYLGHLGNLFPVNLAAVGFVDTGAGNYRLDSSSSYDGVGPGGRDYGAFFPAAGQSWLEAEVQQSGTSAIIRFGRQNLGATTTCTVRHGASSTSSTSGGSRRTVVVTGLTNAQSYHFSVDCGDVDGDFVETLFTAATPSGGDRTIPIQLPAPPAILVGAARATLDYDDNASLSSPTNTQNTSCGSGCTINLVAAAGVQYYRWRWQSAADAVLATSAVQPLQVQ